MNLNLRSVKRSFPHLIPMTDSKLCQVFSVEFLRLVKAIIPDQWTLSFCDCSYKPINKDRHCAAQCPLLQSYASISSPFKAMSKEEKRVDDSHGRMFQFSITFSSSCRSKFCKSNVIPGSIEIAVRQGALTFSKNWTCLI